MSDTVILYCPNCGAGLTFDAQAQHFHCEFCLSDFSEAELNQAGAQEQAQAQEKQAQEFCEGMNEYECPSCGAQIVCDEHTVADFCYYCHNPVILNGRLDGQKRPHRIIPFRYDKAAAEEKFFAFTKKKRFLPRDFFSKKQADKITGVYFPFWITDADTDASAQASATRVRSWRMGDYRYTETSRYRVLRGGEIHFEDIVTNALSEADKQMLEGILPYPSEALQEFSMPYLSGYFAKKRDIEREALSEEIRSRMEQYATTILRDTMRGYSTVHVKELQMRVGQSHWEYALLPVWVLNYQRKGKTYTYAMNGYTGKIYGELPLSYPKLFAASGALLTLGTALLYLMGGLFL